MFKFCSLFSVGAILALGTLALCQDTMPSKRIGNQLPPGFAKLNLDAKQKADAQKIVTDCKAKIKQALDTAATWRTHEKTELMKLLTADQKTQLLKLNGLDFAPEKAPEVKK